mmetsp:Transcript_30115/g.43980  ORF Transcript_30115/g.43980 Transcript_30115/m.43980 type:complete len:336 (+) Transcript_30115:68-1075(+)
MRFYATTVLAFASLSLLLECSHGQRCKGHILRTQKKIAETLGMHLDASVYEAYCMSGFDQNRTLSALNSASVDTSGNTGGGARARRKMHASRGSRKMQASAGKKVSGKSAGKKMSGGSGGSRNAKGGGAGSTNPDFCPPWAPTPDRIAAAQGIATSGKKGGGSPFPSGEEIRVPFNVSEFTFDVSEISNAEIFRTDNFRFFIYEAFLTFDGDLTALISVACQDPFLIQSCTADMVLFNIPNPPGFPEADPVFTGLVSATGPALLEDPDEPFNPTTRIQPFNAIFPLAGGRGLCGLEAVLALELNAGGPFSEPVTLIFSPAVNEIFYEPFLPETFL